MKENNIRLKYYVYNSNFNKKKVEPFNIFENWVLNDAVVKEIKRYIKHPKVYTRKWESQPSDKVGFEAFVAELDSLIRWQEWGRCEYEILVSDMFNEDKTKEKIDCYDQCHCNMEMIAREVIYQYKQQVKRNEKQCV